MSADADTAPSEPRMQLWRNVLLLVGSAAFGGLAVALWNRRELTQIQNERNKQLLAPASSNDPEEEII
ncbi:MAG TPA: hypothetical protein VMU92_05625 [Acidobacteriaceae bacterium]|nr:hypothetical protein [Acidobacteriaceae bacterium]